MKIRDLTNRLLKLVAERMFLIAEWLRPEQPRDDVLIPDGASGPPADWLERTRNIAPEFWMDFTGPIVTDNASTNVEPHLTETRERIVIDRTEPEWAGRSTDSVPNNFNRRITAREASKERRGKSPFLHFKTPEEQKAGPAGASERSLSDYKGSSSRKADSRRHGVEIKNRVPALTFLRGDVGSTKLPSPAKNPKKEENGSFTAKRSRQLERASERLANGTHLPNSSGLPLPAAQTSDRVKVKPPAARLKDPDRRVVSNKPTPEWSISPFTNLPTKSPFVHQLDVPFAIAATYFRQSGNTTAPNPDGFTLQENPKDLTAEDSKVLAEAPWADLPDDFLPRSFEAGESSRSLTEHLLFLEREQAGNI